MSKITDKLWGGRFSGQADEGFAQFNESFSFDRRLFEVDIRASVAHCDGLKGAGVLSPTDAQARLLVDGELAWVYGPRRQELATVMVDESVKRGDVVLRDIAGASPSELVRVVKPDLDSHTRRGHFA